METILGFLSLLDFLTLLALLVVAYASGDLAVLQNLRPLIVNVSDISEAQAAFETKRKLSADLGKHGVVCLHGARRAGDDRYRADRSQSRRARRAAGQMVAELAAPLTVRRLPASFVS